MSREEHDSLGPVTVPDDRYWGAQTARALANFPSGGDTFPPPLVHALGRIKRAAAHENAALGVMPQAVADLVVHAAGEVVDGLLDDHVVAPVWQSGSGTQLNMNVNEVIAGRGNELAGRGRGGREPVHPNDHVNCSQSSNDVIPTALHLAAALQVRDLLRPALVALEDALAGRAAALDDVVKTGRTHLMDALLGRSLMLVTALVPRLGYDRAAVLAQQAQSSGLSLRETVLADGALSAAEYDDLINRVWPRN